MADGMWKLHDDGSFELQEPYKTQLIEAKASATQGWTAGLLGYLTPDETHNGDGRHVGYHVLPEELASYYAQGSTVIYYQHKARRKDPFYAGQLNELLSTQRFPGASGLALKFAKVSQRYYMFIIQPKHRGVVEKTVKDMLSTAWGDHFRLLSLTGA